MKNFLKPTKVTWIVSGIMLLYFLFSFFYLLSFNAPRNIEPIEITLFEKISLFPVYFLVVLPGVYLVAISGYDTAFPELYLLLPIFFALLEAYLIASIASSLWCKFRKANQANEATS